MITSRLYRFGNLYCRFLIPVTRIGLPVYHDLLDAYRVHVIPDPGEVLTVDMNCEETAVIDSDSGNADITSTKNYAQTLREERIQYLKMSVQRTGDDCLDWILEDTENGEHLLRFRLSADRRKISLEEDHTDTGGCFAFAWLSNLLPYAAAERRMLTFHGVLLEYRNLGIVISAPSGTGKTTHARLWRDLKGAHIINGDNAVCVMNEGIWHGCGVPWSGSSGEQIAASVPIKAMVVLERGSSNHCRQITGFEAFHAAYENTVCERWDRHHLDVILSLLEQFLQDVPVYRLSCLPDADAVETLYRAIFRKENESEVRIEGVHGEEP